MRAGSIGGIGSRQKEDWECEIYERKWWEISGGRIQLEGLWISIYEEVAGKCVSHM